MIKKLLNGLAARNQSINRLKRLYKQVRIRVRNFYYWRLPLNEKLVVFEAYRSRSYADSPKAIYEYMLSSEEFKDYRFIWTFRDTDSHAYIENDRTKIVRYESHGYFKAFAQSKYWVVNGWIPQRVQKRPSQVALQCWHGTPLKRLRHDIVATAQTAHKERAVRDNNWDILRFDYFISPSRFASNVFTSAFGLKELNKQDILIETGYPRNDVLRNHTQATIDELRQKLRLPSDKKVLLYAPTWRDDEREDETINYRQDFAYLKQQLGDEYVILFRAHYLVAEMFDFESFAEFVYDVSNIDDVNDLYLVSDILVTDYSSVFFDYANLMRPIVFFMYDLDFYKDKLRGFYIDLDELPGDIVKTEAELVASIKSIDDATTAYADKYKAFNATYNYLDDGNATERAVKKVFKTEKQ